MSGTAVMDHTSEELHFANAAEAEADASVSAAAAFPVSFPVSVPVSAEVKAATGTEAAPERSLWSYIGLALSAVLLILVVALAAVAIVIPKLAGALPMTVLTSSMEPRLPPGTLIIVKPVNPADLAIGDVATYQMVSGKPGVITHRIIAINLAASGGRTFEFMGDNNGAPDAEPVQEAQIQGKLWYSIPLIGWVNNLVNGANKAWIVPVLAGLLLSYAGYMIVSALAEANRARRVRRRIARSALANTMSTAPVNAAVADADFVNTEFVDTDFADADLVNADHVDTAPAHPKLANTLSANTRPTFASLLAEPAPEPEPEPSGGRNAQHDLPAGVPKLKHPMGLDAVGEVEDMFNVRAYDA